MLKLLKTKHNTSYFKATSREKVNHIYSNKTNPPAVGHYRPDLGAIYVKEKAIMIMQEHKSPERKKKKVVICDHLKKNLDPISKTRPES
jgi:hypothetical protein